MPVYRVCKLKSNFNYNSSLLLVCCECCVEYRIYRQIMFHTDACMNVNSFLSTQARHHRGSEARLD
jgi:hypothetical protein